MNIYNYYNKETITAGKKLKQNSFNDLNLYALEWGQMKEAKFSKGEEKKK